MAAPSPIYLDHHATTPVAPEVLEAMLPYFAENFGNPASAGHPYGWIAEEAVARARESVARLLGATAREITFTSGSTESNNMALFGVAEAHKERGRHIVTTAIEHKSVLDPCRVLQERGFEITHLPVGRDGRVNPDDVRRALRPDTILLSVMWVNNEIGTIQPIADIGRIAKEKGVYFHTDAVQAVGHLKIDVEAAGVDLLSLSGHKFYGPKGVGALYVRRKNPRVELSPLFFGGGQERGVRSGTLNVPGIVGLGRAAELVMAVRDEEAGRLRRLRDLFWETIHAGLPGATLNGSWEHRHPGNINFSIPGLREDGLLSELRSDIALSSGSACLSEGGGEGSHVGRALGLTPEQAACTLRVAVGRGTTEDQVRRASARIVEAASRLLKEKKA